MHLGCFIMDYNGTESVSHHQISLCHSNPMAALHTLYTMAISYMAISIFTIHWETK